jgi:hypothetical protein
MSLLIARDEIALYPPAGRDGHGWALPGSVPVWRGRGSLQATPGQSDTQAADGGGHGPHGPARTPGAVLYLPPEAPAGDGMTALIGGKPWALSQCRMVTDPRESGELDCWAATATEARSG